MIIWPRLRRPLPFVFGVAVVALCMASLAPPAVAADMSKTLHVLLLNGEAGMDPAVAFEGNTMSLTENVFDPLLAYDYLARPPQLRPNTLTAMPQVSDNGATYTFHIQPGIYFSSDPVFKGKRRELIADDYVYTFKRMYDPVLKSPWLFLLDGTIVGDAVLKKPGAFDYASVVPGLRALDRYTLQIRLTQPNVNFPFLMAMPATGVVAREVIEANAADPGGHPIGTGPYVVKQWQRSNRILLEANPDFRETIFHAPAGGNLADQAIAKALEGKRLPLVGRIEVKVVEENQTQILGFLNNEFDYLETPARDLANMLVENGKLKPELGKRGIHLSLFPLVQTDFMYMNMEDPVIGGYSNEKIALRRAIALSYNREEDIRVHQKSLALPARSLLPQDVLGYDAAWRSQVEYDPALARALLDHFGYRDRDGDGYRELPDGKPLTLVMHSRASTAGRIFDEMWRKSMDAIGIRITFKSDKYSDIIKASRLGQVQMFEFGWVADYPDAGNYYQLLYGPNIGISNDARFNLPAYNVLFEQASKLSDSPERNRLYRDMDRLLAAYAPWVLRVHPLSPDVQHDWVKNYKRHPVVNTVWRYVDIDTAQRQAAH
jgi:ABC-type transport system substrate-binding protein